MACPLVGFFMRKVILYILLLCFVMGCSTKYERHAGHFVKKAELAARSDLRAARALLDSVRYPEVLQGSMVARYCLLGGMLSDSLHTPLPFIDDLDRAWYYLDEHGTAGEQIRISRYYGQALMREGLADPALNVFLKMRDISLARKDYTSAAWACSYLGDISHQVADYALSKAYYLKAAAYFQYGKDERLWGLTLKNVGREYAALDSFDLALDYMLRADSVIRMVGDSADWSTIYNGIGNVYAMQNKFDLAKPYFVQSIAYEPDNSAPTYFALGSVYLALDSLEQAAICFREAQAPTSNPDTHTELLYHYSLLEEKKGNIASALSYMRQYVDSSEADVLAMKHANLIQVQTLFDRKQMAQENVLLQKGKILLQRLLIGSLLGVLLVVIGYQHRMNQKNRRIMRQAEELHESRNNLHRQELALKQLAGQLEAHQQYSREQLRQKQREYDQKADEVNRLRELYARQRTVILTDSALYKKIKKLAVSAKADREELLTDKEWNALYRLVDAVCPPLAGVLDAAGITPAEKNYCYLAFFRLDAKQEAILLHVSADTPHKNHTRIRQKLHITGSGASLYDYFMQLS